MPSIFMRFPGGRTKALTLSYDDGVEQDVRLIEIMKAYGLRGTFNINSGQFSPEGTTGPVGNVGHRRMTMNDSVKLHKDSGMEIACHGVTHPFLDQLPVNLCLQEVTQDRKNLEEIYGCMVRGLAYPFGTTSDSVCTTLKQCGIAYARTVESTHKFDLPEDWLRLPATCHHTDPELMNLAKTFVEDRRDWGPKMFYLWGHSYEFEDNDNWYIIEDFAKYIGNREDIWYATNIEIYDYTAAYKQLIFSMNGKTVFNPTNTTLYLKSSNGLFCVEPGETIQI
ncbi:MAG: polysaccharide deacetylase family protein [Lachnospiraceae bacterium]|nr:polysaccharide deacetylase family protein [Lachnospiraceae bacterium]